jgi:hypothetical protein
VPARSQLEAPVLDSVSVFLVELISIVSCNRQSIGPGQMSLEGRISDLASCQYVGFKARSCWAPTIQKRQPPPLKSGRDYDPVLSGQLPSAALSLDLFWIAVPTPLADIF